MTLSESDDMRESPGKDLRVDNALRILQERVTWSRQRHTSGPTPPAPHSFNSHSTRSCVYTLLSNRNYQFFTNTIVRKYKTGAVWSESYKVNL